MKTNRQHKEIVDKIIKGYEGEIALLRIELSQAKDLKRILEKIYPPFVTGGANFVFGSNGEAGKLILPREFAEYVDDLFGGKVLKQEGNMAIKIDKNGEVQKGLTKQKVDKGYTYKLVRE